MPRGASRDAAAGRRPRDDRSTGARAAGGKRKKKGGLLWLALGLLALLVLIGLVLLLLRGGDDGQSQTDAGGAKSAATLTASGTALLPVPAAGLASYSGQPAKGTALEVVKVNGNQGFSVGKTGSDPVYVEWGGDVGSNEASTFRPKKGQKVNLTGPVEKAGPDTARVLKLSGADARLVADQGAFVNADRVTQSK